MEFQNHANGTEIINEANEMDELLIYSFPTKSIFNVTKTTNTPLEIQVLDLTGRVVMSDIILSQKVTEVELKRNLPKGIYQLWFSDGIKVQVKKIILE
ncbi:T9SS type A sorting domain-containing protein [Flagellimonas algicola]|uniref:T9SS type A sorting domain-containing protein n=1 Tax=Flagellimonas algicola TaxID=2583815 RepID=A0ABY2WJW7_9FLAO|nr:T9SS type A sorting domain-containing protein [Allomuricauda algicola]TMU55136.1 T9SS type A sorting domain-containing protein [Allomuricauda algicola]